MIETFARNATVAGLGASGRRVVQALRLWVAAGEAARCPLAAIEASLGTKRAVAHFRLLIEEVAEAWPDPFAVSPPCCGRMSHDEQTLGRMIDLACAGDRPGFDRLLCEMLDGDQRDRLLLSASLLGPMVVAPAA